MDNDETLEAIEQLLNVSWIVMSKQRIVIYCQ